MSRLNILLLFLLIGCALSQIKAQYCARGTFVELNRELELQCQLLQEWERLQYEQSVQSKSVRIESVARNDLTMRSVLPGCTQYLSMPQRAAINIAVPIPSASVLPVSLRGGSR
ncbi:cell division protein FtsL [Candidatus Pandoraea novymonadis]|uniref:Cell division protein FtsL n=1 Tax=Candidatus Pandoraea novymonadis TaxID=1808959 RepID=A0ABX5FI07_9BURK|nr:cell division protein FtsL [Candidatus Pandoraea novymonadis]PSB92402.1 Cell division protein FtsL [Candidatus Pandoraea novymonadis]